MNQANALARRGRKQPSQRSEATHGRPGAEIQHPVKCFEQFFCDQCGEDGHKASNCTEPKNLSNVVQKLLQTVNNLRGTKESALETAVHTCKTECHAVYMTQGHVQEHLVRKYGKRVTY